MPFFAIVQKEKVPKTLCLRDFFGLGERIRTSGLLNIIQHKVWLCNNMLRMYYKSYILSFSVKTQQIVLTSPTICCIMMSQ